MKLDQLLDVEKLKSHLTNGVVSAQEHGELPLTIFNYTQKAQFDLIWDDVTMVCRGLIVDEDDNIISRPFKKFFNLNHAGRDECFITNLPKSKPEVTEKLDGSLGIYWKYGDQEGIATRGSFRSEQAEWATKWYLKKQQESGKMLGGKFWWPRDHTPLFEIIYPNNRIVVKYPWSGCVLLSLVNNSTGNELNHYLVNQWAEWNELPCVNLYEKSLDECTNDKQTNFEGYVLTWHEPYLKIKVKLDEYVRLHRIVTGFSPIALWECLRYSWSYDDVKEGLKDNHDFTQWIECHERMFKENFRKLQERVEEVYAGRPTDLPDDPKAARKITAQYFCEGKNKALAPLLFSKLDGHDYSDMIWKTLRPHGAHPWKPIEE